MSEDQRYFLTQYRIRINVNLEKGYDMLADLLDELLMETRTLERAQIERSIALLKKSLRFFETELDEIEQKLGQEKS
jgi:hypothetical protein